MVCSEMSHLFKKIKFNMNKLLTLCVMIVLNSSVFAQVIKNPEDQRPYIEVRGSSEKEVIPDEIFISIVIRERFENREKITIESQEEKLKSLLKEINIDLSNLSLSDANADYVKVRLKTKKVLTKKEYILKVSNAETVGKVFEKLDQLSITDAYILKVNHTKIEELKKEVRIAAIKAAKDKADYLLGAIGQLTGKPLIVNEMDYNYPIVSNVSLSRNYVSGVYSDDKGGYDSEPAIEFQKIKIQSAIYVKFEIK